ncbi:hypothetical protein GIB67_039545 [Kingdonia uniflora]|uniref:Uncharacterized protein n=1 Tax=Kingdonia uniflora TaxID=39325 RepID=A0A7J7LIS8_9MAGN|nr:hypothetical protein GIB67_039545 [Kingdonia uniflora]
MLFKVVHKRVREADNVVGANEKPLKKHKLTQSEDSLSIMMLPSNRLQVSQKRGRESLKVMGANDTPLNKCKINENHIDQNQDSLTTMIGTPNMLQGNI